MLCCLINHSHDDEKVLLELYNGRLRDAFLVNFYPYMSFVSYRPGSNVHKNLANTSCCVHSRQFLEGSVDIYLPVQDFFFHRNRKATFIRKLQSWFLILFVLVFVIFLFFFCVLNAAEPKTIKVCLF